MKLFFAFGVFTCFFVPAFSQAETDSTLVTTNSGIPTEISVGEKETVFVDSIPLCTPDVLEARLKKIESEIPMTFHPRVCDFINYFTVKNRDYVRMTLRRKDMYFSLFEEKLDDYGLPNELKYLSIIESGLNPRAVSSARAAGLWQFMPSTGNLYGLKVNQFFDDRRDPEKSTEAACQYLKQLYGIFGDWHLALAAYNSGPGTVKKAIRRAHYKKSFWEIYNHLPRETRSYVPQFIAIIYTLHYADEHNLWDNDREDWMPYDTIKVRQPLHLETLASFTNTCKDDILYLNPYLLHYIMPETDDYYTLRLPIHAKENLEKDRPCILDSAGEQARHYMMKHFGMLTIPEDLIRISYRVKQEDNLQTIAERNKLKVSDIQKWNQLTDETLTEGQSLHLWVKKKHYPHAPSVKKGYIVKSGDSLWSIAKKRGVTVQQIKKWNHLTRSKLRVGQRLKLG